MKETKDGNYILGGVGDNPAPGFGNGDFWLVFVNNSRELLWEKFFGGTMLDYFWQEPPSPSMSANTQQRLDEHLGEAADLIAPEQKKEWLHHDRGRAILRVADVSSCSFGDSLIVQALTQYGQGKNGTS